MIMGISYHSLPRHREFPYSFYNWPVFHYVDISLNQFPTDRHLLISLLSLLQTTHAQHVHNNAQLCLDGILYFFGLIPGEDPGWVKGDAAWSLVLIPPCRDGGSFTAPGPDRVDELVNVSVWGKCGQWRWCGRTLAVCVSLFMNETKHLFMFPCHFVLSSVNWLARHFPLFFFCTGF